MKMSFKKTILTSAVLGTGLVMGSAVLAQTSTPAATAQTAVPVQNQAPAGRFAKADGKPGPQMLARFDMNKDGKITREEIDAKRKADAIALDANGDGKISVDELTNFELNQVRGRIEERAKARVAMLDTDGDGMLSAAELALAPMGPAEGPHHGRMHQPRGDFGPGMGARQGRADGQPPVQGCSGPQMGQPGAMMGQGRMGMRPGPDGQPVYPLPEQPAQDQN